MVTRKDNASKKGIYCKYKEREQHSLLVKKKKNYINENNLT